MNKITEKVIENLKFDFFTDTDVANLFAGKSRDGLYALVKRAIANKEIIHLRKGLYCLAAKYQRKGVNLYSLAQLIYGPSYISLESALSYHGWIPEAVYTVTSVSMKKSKEFETLLGRFSFSRIPLKVFYSKVERISDEQTGVSFFMARPMKALADYVYVYKKSWLSLEPAVKSLRIEKEQLEKVTAKELNLISQNYKNRRVRQFIEAVKKDLGYER
jgi:predicted transcriptional regulator of viral defense system